MEASDRGKDEMTLGNTRNLMSPGMPTLASQPTAAASVATFYHRYVLST